MAATCPKIGKRKGAQQAGARNIGVRYNLLSRGEVADEGMRGDDNRVSSFCPQCRWYMDTTENAPVYNQGRNSR